MRGSRFVRWADVATHRDITMERALSEAIQMYAMPLPRD